MKDYSIENMAERINSKQTKEYFKEVTSSYFNGNYRAAIVTLYSVVINDLLLKLEVLNEIYADKTASGILNEIRIFQKANPSNPDWEKDIVEKVKERTNLIDNVDYAHITALKQDRHLCAHPVIDKEEKLYTPNKDSVAAHIRNMLESLFIKPPLLSKKILTTILMDISDKKELLIDKESIEKYVVAKYLNNINDSVEVTIFRDLWKFVFKLDNQECDDNRFINYLVLYLLYKRNTALCIQKIKSEQEYFSNILNAEGPINFLISFLSENEFLYNEFREDVHLLITKHVEKDPSAKLVAWFLSTSYLDHLKEVKELIKNKFGDVYPYDANSFAYQRLINIGFSKGYKKEVCDFIIWRYGSSEIYDDADKFYTYIVNPFLENFTEEQIQTLCDEANSNSQVYDRRKSKDDHNKLRRFILEKFGEGFKFSNYERVFK